MSLKAEEKKATLESRLENLLLSSQFSDCSFLVGRDEHQQVFYAHRVLLASCSPVFEAMFFGPLAETQRVYVPDIDPSGFRVLLQYVYTCQAKFIDLEEACSVFYAAKKYLISDLSKICKTFITQEITSGSAAVVYDLAQTFQDQDLYDTSLREMRKNPSKIIRGSETEHVSPALVVDLLSADILNDTEYALFETVLLWTTKECQRRGIIPHGSNYRAVLEECGIWPLLRPLTLKACQFSKLELYIGLFSPAEIDSLKAYFSKRDVEAPRVDEEKLSLPCTINSNLSNRRPTPIHAQICERRRLRQGPPASGPLITSVSFNVSSPVVLRAIRIPSRLCPISLAANKHSQMYDETLDLVIKDKQGHKVARKKHTGKVPYNTDMTIELSEPLLLQESRPYSVSVFMECLNAEYPSYCLSVSEKVKNVIFSFSDIVSLYPGLKPSLFAPGFITGFTFTL